MNYSRSHARSGPRKIKSADAVIAEGQDPFLLLLANTRHGFDAIAKKRAERSFIAFVELFWTVIEQSQPFIKSKVQEEIARHLELVTDEKIENLLVNVPPGFSKSTLVNVFWPAWEWGPKRRPDLRYISWSYSGELTKRDNVLCRKIIDSPLYQRLWGQCAPCRKRKEGAPRCARCETDKRFRLDSDQNAKTRYRNDWGGWRFASSVGGAGTGERADRLIFDDPHNIKQGESDVQRQGAIDWFAGTLPTRARNLDGGLAIPLPPWVARAHGIEVEEDERTDKPVKSATVGIMQRVHLQDISGIILDMPQLGYTHLLIELEYTGAAHPARTYNEEIKAIPSRPIEGYVDFREERQHVANVNIPMRSGPKLVSIPEASDDAWTTFANLWFRIGHWSWSNLADPIRFPKHVVERLKSQLRKKSGSDAVESQLQQWPQAVGGDYFPLDKAQWITHTELLTLSPKCGFKTRGWDLAATDSDKAAATVGWLQFIDTDDRVIFENIVKTREGPDLVEALLKQTADNDRDEQTCQVVQDFPQDPGQAGKYQVSAFTKLLQGHASQHSTEGKTKVTRANPLSAQWKIGNVYILDTPENREAVRIMAKFPVDRQKDEVDAATRGYDSQVRAETPVIARGPKRIALRGNKR